MRVMGIDPGSRKIGFAVIDAEKKKFKYVDSGTIKFEHIQEFMDRLGEIYDSFQYLVEKYHPDEISIESLIYVKSATAYGKLAQARGAMIAALDQTHRKKIFEYAPNLVKQSVAGAGHASKEGVAKTVSMILGVKEFDTADESDALAIALCHAINREFKTPGTGSGVKYSKGRSLKDVFRHKT